MLHLLRHSCFNPYSNGSSFFIYNKKETQKDIHGFNPYSNGSSFFIFKLKGKEVSEDMFQSLF